jgi:hypothetical protein
VDRRFSGQEVNSSVWSWCCGIVADMTRGGVTGDVPTTTIVPLGCAIRRSHDDGRTLSYCRVTNHSANAFSPGIAGMEVTVMAPMGSDDVLGVRSLYYGE